ncbi:MAG: hypothetical protein M3N45_08565 [Actinomycetota bacterium]|nr:hypothetical protein [Actinomycetota bacterium]
MEVLEDQHTGPISCKGAQESEDSLPYHDQRFLDRLGADAPLGHEHTQGPPVRSQLAGFRQLTQSERTKEGLAQRSIRCRETGANRSPGEDRDTPRACSLGGSCSYSGLTYTGLADEEYGSATATNGSIEDC